MTIKLNNLGSVEEIARASIDMGILSFVLDLPVVALFIATFRDTFSDFSTIVVGYIFLSLTVIAILLIVSGGYLLRKRYWAWTSLRISILSAFIGIFCLFLVGIYHEGIVRISWTGILSVFGSAGYALALFFLIIRHLLSERVNNVVTLYLEGKGDGIINK